jgi:hypothetical protein
MKSLAAKTHTENGPMRFTTLVSKDKNAGNSNDNNYNNSFMIKQ